MYGDRKSQIRPIEKTFNDVSFRFLWSFAIVFISYFSNMQCSGSIDHMVGRLGTIIILWETCSVIYRSRRR